MMNKKILSLLVLAVALLSTVGISRVLAYQGELNTYGPNHTEEREDAMRTIMETKDYNGWVALMTEDGRTPGVLNKIDSQEKFNLFAEAYLLTQEGKIDEANAIRSELGLGNGQGRGGGRHMGGNFVDANNNGICDRRE